MLGITWKNVKQAQSTHLILPIRIRYLLQNDISLIRMPLLHLDKKSIISGPIYYLILGHPPTLSPPAPHSSGESRHLARR